MKRRVITLLIFLLLGAIVNIAVAWGCACWQRDSRLFNNASLTSEYELFKDGDSVIAWSVEAKSIAGSAVVGSDWADWGDVTSVTEAMLDRRVDHLPAWASSVRLRPGVTPKRMTSLPYVFALGRGWPCISLSCDMTQDPLTWAYTSTWAIDFGHPKSEVKPETWIPRLLPLRPNVHGFAINTLFYAALLWLLFALVGALRRWRRMKRGLCPACAYPVGASDLCTECGKPVNPRKSASVEPA